MSTAVRWVIAIIIVAALAWLVWWSGWLTNKNGSAVIPAQNATSTQAAAQPEPINGMSASNDASDAAIVQDTAAIDAQISAYTTDTSDVDSSMNDKQVTQ